MIFILISRNLQIQDKGKAFNVSRGNKSKVSIYFPVKQNKALLINFELPSWKILKADISSVSSSLWRSRSKTFTVVIGPL